MLSSSNYEKLLWHAFNGKAYPHKGLLSFCNNISQLDCIFEDRVHYWPSSWNVHAAKDVIGILNKKKPKISKTTLKSMVDDDDDDGSGNSHAIAGAEDMLDFAMMGYLTRLPMGVSSSLQ